LSNAEIEQGRRQALAVVLGQGLLGAIVAIACLAVWGPRAGASALLGAGIGIVATSLMAFAMLRHGEGASAQRVAWSFFSGWVVKVAFTVALLVVAFRSPGVAAAVYPLLVLVHSIPKVALAPVLVVALGANELPRIVVTFLVCFFPLVISIAAGLLAVPTEYIELCRACRASYWRELWRVRLRLHGCR
jgi:ABC-type nitrate/sulfonate/bicarbonate transport system permease component